MDARPAFGQVFYCAENICQSGCSVSCGLYQGLAGGSVYSGYVSKHQLRQPVRPNASKRSYLHKYALSYKVDEFVVQFYYQLLPDNVVVSLFDVMKGNDM